jgi:hypothetical protein
MHLPPSPSWYVYAIDATAPICLLTDDGQISPGLSTEPVRLLADLAVAIHATAWQLGEPELRTLERFIALQRWRR